MNAKNSMILKEIKENGIYIKNIQEGFNKYPNTMIKGTEEYVNGTIRKLFNINGIENSYADFYYGKLDPQERNRVRATLNEKEIRLVESLKLSSEDIFIRLNSEILDILLKLTSNEILFSSFYFTKFPCMVWGNYGHQYPIFFKDELAMKTIMEGIINI